MNREKVQDVMEATGEFVTLAGVLALPFVGFWLKHIFWK